MRYVLVRPDDLLAVIVGANRIPRETLTRLLQARAVEVAGGADEILGQLHPARDNRDPGLRGDGYASGVVVGGLATDTQNRAGRIRGQPPFSQPGEVDVSESGHAEVLPNL